MQQLRSKPGLMPLKIADVLWPEATMRAQDAWTTLSPLLPAVLAALEQANDNRLERQAATAGRTNGQNS